MSYQTTGRRQMKQSEIQALIARIDPKYRPVWQQKSERDQIALAQYFLPRSSAKPVVGPTRPRIIKWYCPFAPQCDFSSGHRYCLNVYAGCDHKCVYCYAVGYEPEGANCKRSFEALLEKDIKDLNLFDVPPAPVHLSNSTDPFQPLENRFGHTKMALEKILQHRHRFTTVTLLTKNPLLPVESGYLDLFRALLDHHPQQSVDRPGSKHWPGLVVEVSLAFWEETARRFYDPGAPTINQRMEGITALRRAGIPVVLRIDPLFPRSPITENPVRTMADFKLPEAQTLDDLERLVSFGKEVNVKHIVYSAAKIVQPRGRKLSESMTRLRKVYEAFAAPEKLIWRGGSWRLPLSVAEQKIVEPFLEICRSYDVRAKYCKLNLIETP